MSDPASTPTLTNSAEILADVPIFALLDPQERATLAERLDVVKIAAGSTIFSYGDPGDTLYVVKKGAVELFFDSDTGDRIVLEKAGPGDFFGELSLFDGLPRMASALVLEDLEALVVDRGDLDEFFRIRPAAALDLLSAVGRRLRETTRILRRSATRNVNELTEDKRTWFMRGADWITDFSGSLPFLFLHVLIFAVWIGLNAGPIPKTSLGSSVGNFDPFPFGLLTMVVSLEAIILSVFVLLSQNRQAARDRVRNDIEYEINFKAELQIAQMHVKVDALHAELLARLERIERRHIVTTESLRGT